MLLKMSINHNKYFVLQQSEVVICLVWEYTACKINVLKCQDM